MFYHWNIVLMLIKNYCMMLPSHFLKLKRKTIGTLVIKIKRLLFIFFVRNGNSVASCTILLVSSHFYYFGEGKDVSIGFLSVVEVF